MLVDDVPMTMHLEAFRQAIVHTMKHLGKPLCVP